MEIITTKELTYYARKGWTVWQYLQYRKLIKAETTGPEKDKITPKITVTAKILWIIYVSFTAAQTVLPVVPSILSPSSVSRLSTCVSTAAKRFKTPSLAS